MKAFGKYFVQDKENIIRVAKTGIGLIEHRALNDKQHSSSYYMALKNRLLEFVDYMDSCNLPILNEPFAYFVEIRTDAISLYIRYVSDLKVVEGANKKIYDTIDEYKIIEFPFNLLSIEEYAELNETTSYVIAQWIRRGKLKNAKKIGRKWFIPEIEESATDNRESVYEWKIGKERVFDEEFDYLNKYSKIIIKQCKESKMNFNVTMYDELTGNEETKTLSTKEKQKLETMLISNEKVKFSNNLIITIG